VVRIDELLERLRKQQEAARWQRIMEEVREWRKTRILVRIDITVKNKVSGGWWAYSVASEDELEDYLDWLARKGPRQPFPIREVVPGVYEVGPFVVYAHRVYKDIGGWRL